MVTWIDIWVAIYYLSGSVRILRFCESEYLKQCKNINRTNPQNDGHLDQLRWPFTI